MGVTQNLKDPHTNILHWTKSIIGLLVITTIRHSHRSIFRFPYSKNLTLVLLHMRASEPTGNLPVYPLFRV